MERNIIGALICALIGFAVACLNYFISKRVLQTRAERFASIAFFRQLIQIACLAAVYFAGSSLKLDVMYLLIGTVIGMTAPMLVFTKKLVGINENKIKKSDSKEAEDNG